MKQFRVIIAGSRKFDDYQALSSYSDKVLANKLTDPATEVIIVSGHATGADSLGERYAAERGLQCELHPADWSKGRAAGPIRNAEMASIADALIAFPKVGELNKGTKNMISQAESKGLLIRIYNDK